jgi:mono/diheme cytochrome c family protein
MFDRNNSLPLSLFLQAERQARLDSLVIKACKRGTMSGLAEWLSALGTWGTRLARNLADEWLLRSAIRELHQVDDRTLADIGITRCGIEYAVRHGRPHAWQYPGERQRYSEVAMRWSLVALAGLAIAGGYAVSGVDGAESAQVAHGKYLVQLGGCTDCHTPGHLLGKPDMSRFLGGSDVGLEVPGLGVFVAPNLTPDKVTGLGNWTKDQIAAAIQTGVRPDGRILAPIMPWRAYAGLRKSDVRAIVEYLSSLPAISHKVPGPFGLDEKPAIFRMTILPPEKASQHD